MAGELVTERPVDWNAALPEGLGEIELQLVSTGKSRITGAFVHDGELYIPCDLGFIWRRVPDPSSRRILHTIWLFKDWHERAAEDGRAMLRVDGKRYEATLTRFEDPELEAVFRARLEAAAGEYFGGDGIRPGGDPKLMWFFKVT